MKYALISSIENVSYVSSWDTNYKPAKGIVTYLGWRVAGVYDAIPFEVTSPLFYVECDDDADENTCYYDESNEEIKFIPLTPVSPDFPIN
jgi:hypothetical protein